MAMCTLPPNDPRLRASALLAWEAQNVAAFLAPLRAFFVSVSARDKTGRLFQYLCALLKGVLRLSDPEGTSAARQRVIQILRKLQFDLSNARRTFRLAEVGPLLTLSRLPQLLSDEPFWVSRLVGSLAAAGFNVADRCRWLQEHSLLSGAPTHSARLAARMLCVAQVATAVRLAWRTASTPEAARRAAALRVWITSRTGTLEAAARARRLAAVATQERDEDGADREGIARDVAEFRRGLYDIVKALLNAWQAGHIGRVPGFHMHDATLGLLGTLTSASDLYDMVHG